MRGKHPKKRNVDSKKAVWATILLVAFAVMLPFGQAEAKPKVSPPEKIKAIIIGDRVVDIAYNLGVMPEAMSLRGSLWPMANKLKTVSQILGCPKCTTEKNKDTIPKALKKYGIDRVIVEKSNPFCLYMPQVNPENIAAILDGMSVTIEYVDFSQGLESAIRQTAKLLDRESKADAVIKKYKQNMVEAKALLPTEKSGKTVIIFNGTFQPSTGKAFIRVEAPGGYADQFLLKPLGFINAGDCFKPSQGKASKGHYAVRKKKGEPDLSPIIKANPDVIVMAGDTFVVQKALAECQAANPDLAQVKAIRNLAVFSLPAYIDSSVIEYPIILKKWSSALVR